MSSEQRFRSAIAAAQRLPQELLTQGQMLKLYALSRQANYGPAPAEPPAEAKTKQLEQAKWEAWNDVRKLTQAQAMDAYSQIIEGLTAMMMAMMDDAGPPPPDARQHVNGGGGGGRPGGGPGSSSSSGGGMNGMNGARRLGEEEDEEEESADESAEEGEEEDEDEDEEAPTVTRTVWETKALGLAAGATFDVPLAYDGACRCSYTFEVANGAGPVAFKIVGGGHTYASEYLSECDAKVEVVPPDGGRGGGVLIATLDNTASTFSSVEVKCIVALEPLAELQALEDYNSRMALRGLIARKEATLEQHTESYARVGREAQSMQSELQGLRERLTRLEGELKIKYKQMEQGAEMAELMAQEIHELRVQLRNAP